MSIQPIQGVTSTSSVGSVADASTKSPSEGFANILRSVVADTNGDQLQADKALVDFSQGKNDDIQSVVTSVVKADLSFRFFLEMRNKLTESYQELSRMQF